MFLERAWRSWSAYEPAGPEASTWGKPVFGALSLPQHGILLPHDLLPLPQTQLLVVGRSLQL